ncbi:Hypothetical predicted protein [Cloeon dipterum]|uniref:DOMON domain-containing protein n=1 Tax=Cloeon dipterum TaxID=197152 RepID=A0A8S1DEY7_9INSE|nr:Hypothetical predicted protein [Cloeon dipterum]
MGKVLFYDRFLFVLITFLVSGIASTETVVEIEEESNHFLEIDENFSMNMHYANHPDDIVNIFWKDMETEKNVYTWSEGVYNKVSFDVPFGFKLFDLNVTHVVVTKQGIIRTEDFRLYDKWTIAPLNAKSGMSRSKISRLVKGNHIYIQWNNFRFDDEYFGEQEFSFQVRLGAGGDINFVYKKVPYNMTDLRKNCDLCLEDKFGVMYRHEEVFEVPRRYKESYELGFSMDFEKYPIKEGTVISFFPGDWCMGKKNYFDCTESNFYINLREIARCSWCPAIRKCSSTRDSLRHVWKENKCDDNHNNDPSSGHSDNKIIFGKGKLKSTSFLIFWFISPMIVMVTLCVVSKDQIVRMFHTNPAQWFRDFIECMDEPNRPDNYQAGDQNNDQEGLELQELPSPHVQSPSVVV